MISSSGTGSLQSFYERIDGKNLAPLWEVLGALVPPAPVSRCAPVHWSYSNVRPHLDEAGRLISAEEAERRVLVLENPALRRKSSITATLYAGYQLLLPKEIAHSHRHTATAIRLVVEGSGACTSVDGERALMEPGDFLITPSWTFHDHANPGDEPVVWLDGLDVPLVQFLEAGFSEKYPQPSQPLTRSEGDAFSRYGQNMLPATGYMPQTRNPLFRYPYSQTRATLQRLAAQGPVDLCHGVKQQFINPMTGGAATSTMAAFMQWLPGGFVGDSYRSTDSAVFCVVEGSGVTHVGDQCFAWEPHDVFVVPAWVPARHESKTDSVLFSFSDRPTQQALGIWREERAD